MQVILKNHDSAKSVCMKRFLFVSIILLLFSLSITECKKKQVVTEYIPGELKEYALFQPGSFWIYKNENTGTFDSTYISEKPEFTYYSESSYDNTITEICHIFYNGPFIQTTYLDPYTYTMGFIRYGFEAIQSNSFVPGRIFQLDGATTLKYFPLVDSMTLSNKTFHNVFVTQWQYITSQGDTFRNTSYFVKKIGLIKFNHKEPNADTTWHLINYHTLQ